MIALSENKKASFRLQLRKIRKREQNMLVDYQRDIMRNFCSLFSKLSVIWVYYFQNEKIDMYIKRSTLFSYPAQLETVQLMGSGRLALMERLGGRLASGH